MFPRCETTNQNQLSNYGHRQLFKIETNNRLIRTLYDESGSPNLFLHMCKSKNTISEQIFRFEKNL